VDSSSSRVFGRAGAPGKRSLTNYAKVSRGNVPRICALLVELDAMRMACPARRRLVGVILRNPPKSIPTFYPIRIPDDGFRATEKDPGQPRAVQRKVGVRNPPKGFVVLA